jgi:hypothetical protein
MCYVSTALKFDLAIIFLLHHFCRIKMQKELLTIDGKREYGEPIAVHVHNWHTFESIKISAS